MTVYADASTIGGCFDEEFQEWSVALADEFKIGKKIIMLSDLTLQELEFAREEVREKIKEIPKKYQISIGNTDEAIQLAELYTNEGALTIKSYNDALHIALATLNNAGVLAS